MDTHIDLKRHSKEWRINENAWINKLELREAYKVMYEKIRNHLKGKKVLELGSGLCKSKEWIPELITSDREKNPWVDSIESAYKISSKDETWDHIIMLDVFHHLERPKAALKEIHRVLKPKGSVVIMEPDLSFLGWAVYGLAHKEPVGYFKKISLDSNPPKPEKYYACQSHANRIFKNKDYRQIYGGFSILYKERICMLKYILSGGFSGPNLLQYLPNGLITTTESTLKKWPKISSTRVLIVLEKNAKIK
jgi:SAM-dependent methyltransferase